MKKLFRNSFIGIIAIFLIVALFAPQTVNAQTAFSEKSADLTHFYAKFPSTNVDSLNTVYSEWFTLRGYTYESMTTYPLRAFYQLSSASGKPKLLGIIQGCSDLSDANTIATVDSLTALYDSTETFNPVTLNFNGKNFPWYRIAWIGKSVNSQSKNRADTYVKAELWIERNKKQ